MSELFNIIYTILFEIVTDERIAETALTSNHNTDNTKALYSRKSTGEIIILIMFDV